MGVFELYARYYELLYRDKDYSAESKFVHDLIQKHRPGAASILELGCGTGAHAQNLITEGYRVHGVDMSDEMLKRAEERRTDLPRSRASQLSFSQGDIRHLRLNKEFDVVISLFHVMSYQVTDKDLQMAISTAAAHLKSGGVFIFDCWYGPAVLTDRPAVRVKRMEDDLISIIRIAEPVMHPNEDLVDVNYTVFITEKATGVTDRLTETHRMRYLFQPQIGTLLEKEGFQLQEGREWMTDRPLGFDTWGGYFIAGL